jgi:hypothetical protein
VLGTNVRGYFIFDESIYLLLDIGFIWQIYLDTEMGLLPFPVTIQELDADSPLKEELKSDCEILLSEIKNGPETHRIKPVQCAIEEVDLFTADENRRIIVQGEDQTLSIETSFSTRAISVREFRT